MTDPRCELLVIDKPEGMTSHDVVRDVRKIIDDPRVGHTGTLDPFATGVLVLCLGIATRLVEYMLFHGKRYHARLRLGEATDTYDRTGQILESKPVLVDAARIEAELAAFRGEFLQTPPPYSAVRVAGKRAHLLARKGKEFELAPRPVTVHALRVLAIELPYVTLDIECSAGLYIRSIAHELGARLGCGGHLADLRRVRAGSFTIDDAHPLVAVFQAKQDDRLRDLLLPPERALLDWPAIHLDAAGDARVFHGHAVPFPQPVEQRGMCRIHSSDGRLFAAAEIVEDGRFAQPRKVLR